MIAFELAVKAMASKMHIGRFALELKQFWLFATSVRGDLFYFLIPLKVNASLCIYLGVDKFIMTRSFKISGDHFKVLIVTKEV